MLLRAVGQDENVSDISYVISERTGEPYESVRRRAYSLIEQGYLSGTLVDGRTVVKRTEKGDALMAELSGVVARRAAIDQRIDNASAL
jgi:hypothetical protein